MSDNLKITKAQADQAFGAIVNAINAAMTNRFPIGIEHVEKHMQIKGALQVLGEVCRTHFDVDAPVKKES